MLKRTVETPFGDLTLVEEEGAITALEWTRVAHLDRSALLDEGARQLADYAGGTREVFDLPLRVRGSQFQQEVCRVMADIPFGYTRTYGEIAKELGVPAQSVGQACGGNPIPLIIPCHRVLAAHGLGGFSAFGGVETKVGLLRHEGAAGLLI